MCLYPKLIKNPKYKSNKKNGGVIPAITDPRVLYVPIGCGKCMECKKQEAGRWKVRLMEDIKENKNGIFITLTFSNQSIKELCRHEQVKGLEGYELDNGIATIAIRLFLERWRKKFGKSLRHWLVTELGHNGTENIHVHGIVWTDQKLEELRSIWNYGFIWPTKDAEKHNYVNSITINYITKYITKTDIKHKYFKPKVLTSPGIGSAYTEKPQSKSNAFNGIDTLDTYRTDSGFKIALPIYYKNKIYTETEREKLWLQKLDKNERWVGGEKIKADDTESYYKLLKHYRKINNRLGYNDDSKNWEIIEYEKHRRQILLNKRIGINKEGYPEEWNK